MDGRQGARIIFYSCTVLRVPASSEANDTRYRINEIKLIIKKIRSGLKSPHFFSQPKNGTVATGHRDFESSRITILIVATNLVSASPHRHQLEDCTPDIILSSLPRPFWPPKFCCVSQELMRSREECLPSHPYAFVS